MADHELEARRTVIGGRHGSPSITIAWPFSNIVNTDPELRDAIADLATLVARLAAPGIAESELATLRTAAEELSSRLATSK